MPPHLSAVAPATRCELWPTRLSSRMNGRSRVCGHSKTMSVCVNVCTSSGSRTHTLRMNICDREGKCCRGHACNQKFPPHGMFSLCFLQRTTNQVHGKFRPAVLQSIIIAFFGESHVSK
jgi:hypothetical protein